MLPVWRKRSRLRTWPLVLMCPGAGRRINVNYRNRERLRHTGNGNAGGMTRVRSEAPPRSRRGDAVHALRRRFASAYTGNTNRTPRQSWSSQFLNTIWSASLCLLALVNPVSKIFLLTMLGREMPPQKLRRLAVFSSLVGGRRIR